MSRYIILLLSLVLAGCAPKFSQAKVDALGYLPADDDADLKVSVNEGLDTHQFKKILYVQTEMHGVANWAAYQDTVMNSLRELHFFDEVVTRKPTIYVNATPPHGTVTQNPDKNWFDMTDPTPYHVLIDQYGDHFLIGQATLRNQSSDIDDLKSYYFEFKLIEPRTSHVVFQASKKGTTTLGIDRAVINPVLNYARGYLLHYDSTYVPNHPPTRSLADVVEKQYFIPTTNWE